MPITGVVQPESSMPTPVSVNIAWSIVSTMVTVSSCYSFLLTLTMIASSHTSASSVAAVLGPTGRNTPHLHVRP